MLLPSAGATFVADNRNTNITADVEPSHDLGEPRQPKALNVGDATIRKVETAPEFHARPRMTSEVVFVELDA